MKKIIPSRPGSHSDDSRKPEVKTFDPRAPSGPFGKRTGFGMNNPTSFSSGIYDTLSREADRLHPVGKGKRRG